MRFTEIGPGVAVAISGQDDLPPHLIEGGVPSKYQQEYVALVDIVQPDGEWYELYIYAEPVQAENFPRGLA